jgi:hypothetical protein
MQIEAIDDDDNMSLQSKRNKEKGESNTIHTVRFVSLHTSIHRSNFIIHQNMPLTTPKEVTEVFGWDTVMSDAYFVLQKKRSSFNVRKGTTPTIYRILMTLNQLQVATATTKKEIMDLWETLHSSQQKNIEFKENDIIAVIEKAWKDCQEKIETTPIHNLVRSQAKFISDFFVPNPIADQILFSHLARGH